MEQPTVLYILQRGVQWKQGVVNCMVLYIILLYSTTPIHCTPDPLHPPLQSIHGREARVSVIQEDDLNKNNKKHKEVEQRKRYTKIKKNKKRK